MSYARTYSGMWLCALTAEQRERTCTYWYTVTTYGGTPHTAFRSKPALEAWLKARGLEAEETIPEPGNWACFRIKGEYRQEAYLYDAPAFWELKGERTREMSNGDYTLAIITTDPYDNIRTVNTLNPNVKDRPTFNHAESRELEDVGAF